MKIIVDGAPYVIIASEFVKPGKGQAFTRAELRSIKSGRVVERTYKSGESVEAADIVETEMKYLYRDNDVWYFMDQQTFEQYPVDQAILGEVAQCLKSEEICKITFWNNEPLLVSIPNFVVLEVVDTEPGVKGDTVSGALKKARMETGVVIKVPLFIENGEHLKIDTRTLEYVSRVRDTK